MKKWDSNSKPDTHKKGRWTVRIDHPRVRYDGWDGHDSKSAVFIRGALNTAEGLVAERIWLLHTYPGSRIEMRMVVGENDRLYDLVEIITAEGESKNIWFDISDFFGT